MFGLLEWLTFARIRRARSTRIADLPGVSFAKIVGVAGTEGDVLRAPFSGDPCVACRLSACEHGSSITWAGNIPVRDTVTVGSLTLGEAFWVQDATGKALVQLHGRALLFGQERSFRRGTPVVEANLSSFLAGRDQGEIPLLASADAERWYWEEIIPVGATVAVMGRVLAPSSETGVAGTSPAISVLEPDDSPVIVSTRRRDSKR